jgi:hypothetical protein
MVRIPKTLPVPPLKTPPQQQANSAAREAAELRYLNAEAEKRELANAEQKQKINIRRAAILAGIVVIVTMLVILVCLIRKTYWGQFVFMNPAIGVAMIVAPITSVTAIVVAILVGAFRKFDEKDLDKLASGVSGVAGLATTGK